MELDQERSGHFKENILSLVFTGVSSDIGIELNSEKATGSKNTLFNREIWRNK